MALQVSDFKPWRTKEVFKKDENFQHMGRVYRVLESFIAGPVFNPLDSRFTLTSIGQGSADDARGISSVAVNEDGDLIITYTDGQSSNAGNVRPETQEDRLTMEHLSVNGAGIISNTAFDIDDSKPVKVCVNGIAYISVDPANHFTTNNKTITWVSSEFSLNSSDTVIAEYYKDT